MRKKVLIVEDDPELRELLSYNLRKAGFCVGTAADGIEGLKKAKSLTPDLILLDLMLPELDGFSVCEVLRRDSIMAAVPIVIVTAMDSQLARLSGLDSGATDYISKTASLKAVVSRVQCLISNGRPPASALGA